MNTSRAVPSVFALAVGFSLVISGGSALHAQAAATKLPLNAGTVIKKGTTLTSASGNHTMTLAPDGNMVVSTKSGGYVWGLDKVVRNITAAGVDRVEYKADGTLAAYNVKGVAVWTASAGRLDPTARLNIADDGTLQVATATEVLWASNGKTGPIVIEATKLPLTAGFVLKKGMKYPSPAGNFNLVLGTDGNLMVTDKDGGYLWGLDQQIANFAKAGSDRVEIKADGSFAAYNARGAAIWTPPTTRRDPKAGLTLTNDGALQLIAADGAILWANDGLLTPRIKVFTKPVSTKTCKDSTGKENKEGWDRCIELANPRIRIFSTAGTSASAVNAVANIYTEMMNLLLPTAAVPDPKKKFDRFKVYITNNESWEVQSKLPVVGTMWPAQTGPTSGRFLQGGASDNHLWISEQMIAKKGVKIRNDDKTPDNAYRTFDQVVHEMAHSIDRQLVDDGAVRQFTGGVSPVESFAFRVQQWFGVPAGTMPAREEALLKQVFSARAGFSIEGYRP